MNKKWSKTFKKTTKLLFKRPNLENVKFSRIHFLDLNRLEFSKKKTPEIILEHYSPYTRSLLKISPVQRGKVAQRRHLLKYHLDFRCVSKTA